MLVAVHAERAGEFVGDVEGFDASGFVEIVPAAAVEAILVEEVEALAEGGEVLLPELGEDGVDLAWVSSSEYSGVCVSIWEFDRGRVESFFIGAEGSSLSSRGLRRSARRG